MTMTTTPTRQTMHGCPDWCTRPDSQHDGGYDSRAEAYVIDHDGPDFGENIASGGSTLANTDTLALGPRVDVECSLPSVTDPAVLRTLAANLMAAANWLDEVQARPGVPH